MSVDSVGENGTAAGNTCGGGGLVSSATSSVVHVVSSALSVSNSKMSSESQRSFRIWLSSLLAGNVVKDL